MSFDKTIQICIFDGISSGRMMCELSNWNGRIYKVSRNELDEFSKRPDCNFTGVYYLFGKDEENNDTVYIGEAEDMLVRIKQHLKDKDYWNDAVIVLSKDNNLNKAHVKYLENSFYTIAKDANRFVVLNRTVPTMSSVSEFDEGMLKEFIENARLLVSTLGYKVFEEAQQSIQKAQKKDFFYIKAARGADAKGIPVADGFAVTKDSLVASSTAKSMAVSLKKNREKLFNEGVIDANYAFTTDYVFSSPSTAAAVIMGRNANGRTEWKTEDNRSLKELEEANS